MKSKQAIVTTSLLLAVGLPSAMAQTAPTGSTASGLTAAGTIIQNRATLEYTPPSNPGETTPPKPIKIDSNTVNTRVTPVCAVSIVPNGSVQSPAHTRSIIPGESVTLPYTVSNVGNFEHTFSLNAADVPGHLAFAGWTVHEDLNGNNIVDPNEPALTSVTLSAEAGKNQKKLLVKGISQPSLTGDAFVNLVASCGTNVAYVENNPALGTDEDNISKVFVAPPGTPVPTKKFEPATITAGQNTVVTITVNNPDNERTGKLVIEDDLQDQRNKGLIFVPGSLNVDRINSTGAIVEYRDAQGNYSTTEPLPAGSVFGIRITLPNGLEPRTEGIFTFTMHADAMVTEKSFTNTVVVDKDGKKIPATAPLTLNNVPEVWIGPRGNPLAAGDDDRQRKPGKDVANGEICFDHTVKNTGNVADRYRFNVEFTLPAANVPGTKIIDIDTGNELVQPLLLRAGESRDLRVCYTSVNSETPIESTIRVTGERIKPGETTPVTDPTFDAVMLSTLLIKSVVAEPAATVDDKGVHVLDFDAWDKPGQEQRLTYTLNFTNTTGRPMRNVVVSDDLPAGLDYITSSHVPTEAIGTVNADGSVQDAKLRWNIPEVAVGEEVNITVTTRVDKIRVSKGAELDNRFRVTHDDPTSPIDPSDKVTVRIPLGLEVQKAVVSTGQQYRVGEKIRFKVTVTNPADPAKTNRPLPVHIYDRTKQDNVLEYIAGSTTYKGPNHTEAVAYKDRVSVTRTIKLNNPDKFNLGQDRGTGDAFWPEGTTVDKIMYWDASTDQLHLKPGESAELEYEMRVLPNANNHRQLDNFVMATDGEGNSLTATSFANLKILEAFFKPVADIIGRVFIDRDRNGIFDKNIDTPVDRARLALAGGRLALTDTNGRYSFLNVPMGTHAVRLDPGTTPYPPLVKPQEGGLIGTQTAHVTGLTSIDFPLAPLGGEIDVVRRTNVQSGPISLSKAVFKTANGYAVSMTINVSESVRNVNISDPLPAGARLLSGTAGYNGALAAGQHNISYTFTFSGEPRQAVTDPQIDWR